MKYPLLASLVPNGEYFDESAIVNEGGFLSVTHLDAIEKAMSDNAAIVQDVNEQLSTANSTIEQHTARITELEEAATKDADTKIGRAHV